MAEKAFCIDESLGSGCSPEANVEVFAQLGLYLSLGEKNDRAWGPPLSPAPCFLCLLSIGSAGGTLRNPGRWQRGRTDVDSFLGLLVSKEAS